MKDVGEVTTTKAAALTPPGPRGLPWFGSVLPAWRDPLTLFLQSRERYGDFVRFKFGPFQYYLVNDPDIVKHVLVDNPKGYTKSRNYLGLKIVLGEGLLTSEGDHWRRQRKLAQPAFHRDKLAGFADSMAMATRDMLTRWTAEGADEAFCIHAEMMRLTFRIVGLTLFSSDVDGDAKDVGHALEVAMHWANDYAESMIRVPPYIPTPGNVRFKRAKKTLDDVVFRLIAERRAQAAKSGDFGSDLLGMLMAATEEPDPNAASSASSAACVKRRDVCSVIATPSSRTCGRSSTRRWSSKRRSVSIRPRGCSSARPSRPTCSVNTRSSPAPSLPSALTSSIGIPITGKIPRDSTPSASAPSAPTNVRATRIYRSVADRARASATTSR